MLRVNMFSSVMGLRVLGTLKQPLQFGGLAVPLHENSIFNVPYVDRLDSLQP